MNICYTVINFLHYKHVLLHNFGLFASAWYLKHDKAMAGYRSAEVKQINTFHRRVMKLQSIFLHSPSLILQKDVFNILQTETKPK